MPPSPSIDLDRGARGRLLGIARDSIRHGFDNGDALVVDLKRVDGRLALDSAAFVTLLKLGELRGCIGSLQPSAPLAQAVATSAFNAAFRDYRFPELRAEEFDALAIEVSVLSPMEPVAAASRDELLAMLEPGVDGLLLEDRGRRATFLPKVWEKMASPHQFVEQLLLKAGLPPDYWSGSLRVSRYRTLSFGESG